MTASTGQPGTAPPGKRGRLITRCLWAAVILLGLLLVLRLLVIAPFRIPTASMEPALLGDRPGEKLRGDTVLVLKVAYLFSTPRRWEVVAFRSVPEEAKGNGPLPNLVKRVVGLPGETVEIRNDEVWIDGELAPRPAALAGVRYLRGGLRGSGPVQLGPEEYFVLGDNSALSRDSRHWGPLPRSRIFGKVFAILQPWSRIGFVE